ncbi:unnamed protein product [Arctogadus glacialis]
MGLSALAMGETWSFEPWRLKRQMTEENKLQQHAHVLGNRCRLVGREKVNERRGVARMWEVARNSPRD